MADHAEHRIGDHVVGLFQHNLKQIVQRRGLFAGNYRTGFIGLRLAQQRPGIADIGLFQLVFQNGTGVAGTILNGER
ncbi:hypothetical protein D3C81_1988650 [compost metagenome]